MRFYCAHCQAKYNIDDSRLPAGKVLRINCKKCGALMRIAQGQVIEGAILKEEPQPAAQVQVAQARVAQAPVQAPAPAAALPPKGDRWFILVDQERQGPFSARTILEKYQQKSINKFTFVWSKGMANWQPLHETTEFASKIIQLEQSSKPRPVAAPAKEAPVKTKVEALTPDALPDELSFSAYDALMSAPPETNMGRVVNNDGSTSSERLPPAFLPQPMPVDSLDSDYQQAPAGEATRIFFANAGIYKRRRNQKIAAIIIAGVVLLLAGFIVADANGWVQLPGMGAIYEKTDMLDPNKERGMERIQVKLSRQDLTPEEREALRKKLHLYEEVDVASLKQVDGQKANGKKGKNRGKGNSGNGAARSEEYHEEFKKEAPAAKGTNEDLMNSMFSDTRKKDKKVEPIQNAKVSTSDLPAGLTQEAITNVIADGKRALGLCTSEAMKAGEKLSGRMEVEFTIQGTGKVSEVRIVTKKFKDSRFAGCVSRTVGRWNFPRFNGEPVTVSYPIIITLGI